MTETADRPNRRFVAWIVVALVVVIADQGTKWAIVEWLDLYGRVPINSFINITHQQNTGAAFSFLAGAGGWQRWFFVVLATAVSAVIVVWLWRIRREGPLVLMAGLSLVLGGAVGNLIDRARQELSIQHIGHSCRTGAGSDNVGARCPTAPYFLIRFQEFKACGQPLLAQGIGKHLHTINESDH